MLRVVWLRSKAAGFPGFSAHEIPMLIGRDCESPSVTRRTAGRSLFLAKTLEELQRDEKRFGKAVTRLWTAGGTGTIAWGRTTGDKSELRKNVHCSGDRLLALDAVAGVEESSTVAGRRYPVQNACASGRCAKSNISGLQMQGE